MNAVNEFLVSPRHTAARSHGTWVRPKWKTRFRLGLALLCADLAALAAAMLPALAFSIGDGNTAFMLVVTPLYFISAIAGNAYSSAALARRAVSVALALRSLIVATASVLFVAFYLKSSANYSRALVAFCVGCSVVTLTAGRLIIDAVARRMLHGDPWQVITICDGIVPVTTSDFMVFVDSQSDADDSGRGPDFRERFALMVEGADRVVVLCEPARRAFWTNVLRGASVQGEIIHEEMGVMGPVGVAEYRGMPTLVVTRGPLNLRDRLFKRALDLAISVSAIVLLLPLLAVAAIAVRLQDGGPVLFLQPRLGRDNRSFNIYKFRTMRVAGSDAVGTRSTARDDARVTRVGRFLRASSFDELPQLFNVLRGQMSIVGPRPHALGSTAEEQLFWDVDERYWHRHAIKPGMTGLAQVRGFRGATQVRADLTNRLQSDLEYTSNWTIWRDILIIIRTCGVVFHHNAF